MQRRTSHKDLQLCAQVQRTLYYVLGSAVGDEALADLQVMEVEPMPDATRLLITLKAPNGHDLEMAYRQLNDAAKAIRAEVAASINRRKAPEVVFRIVRAGLG